MITETELIEKYAAAPEKLSEMIQKRKAEGLLSAFGYASNLDLLCSFQPEALSRFLTEELNGSDLSGLKPVVNITTRRELAQTILYYCINGLGGEADIENTEALSGIVQFQKAIGGTGVQAALALSAVGGECLAHLTDASEDVLKLLSSPLIHAVHENGVLCTADDLTARNEPEPHYIVQFRKGDRIRVGSREYEIPRSNRLILTQFRINGKLPLNPWTLRWIEENASRIPSLLISGFNCIPDLPVLLDRLQAVREHAGRFHQGRPGGIVYYENGDFHQEELFRAVFQNLLPVTDIVGMNEEELSDTMRLIGEDPDGSDPLTVVRSVLSLIERFGIKKGMVIHTKDFSMYAGKPLDADIESGLMFGNMMAASKAIHGSFGTPKEVRETLPLPLSETGLKFRRIISESEYGSQVILVPSRYLDRPRYTIGLGDAFTAGVQLCF